MALCTQTFYVTAYELSHLTYHLPTGHPVRRLPFYSRLAELHFQHHDIGLMGKWNFTIMVPFADWLFGTIAPKALVDIRRHAAAR